MHVFFSIIQQILHNRVSVNMGIYIFQISAQKKKKKIQDSVAPQPLYNDQ